MDMSIMAEEGIFKEYFIHKSDDKTIYRFLSSRFAAKLLLKAGKIKSAKLSKNPYHAKKIRIDDTKILDLGG